MATTYPTRCDLTIKCEFPSLKVEEKKTNSAPVSAWSNPIEIGETKIKIETDDSDLVKLTNQDFQITPAVVVNPAFEECNKIVGKSMAPERGGESKQKIQTKKQREQIKARNKVSTKTTKIMESLAEQSAKVGGSIDAQKAGVQDVKAELKEVTTELKSIKDMIGVIRDATIKSQDPKIKIPETFLVTTDPKWLLSLKQRELVSRSGLFTCKDRFYSLVKDQPQDPDVDLRCIRGVSVNMVRKLAQIADYMRVSYRWIGHDAHRMVSVSKVVVMEYIRLYGLEMCDDHFESAWEILCRQVNIPYNMFVALKEDTKEFLIDLIRYQNEELYIGGSRQDFQDAPSTPWYVFITVIVVLTGLITCLCGRLGLKIASAFGCSRVPSARIYLLLVSACTSTVQYVQHLTRMIYLTLSVAFRSALGFRPRRWIGNCCANIGPIIDRCCDTILFHWLQTQIFLMRLGLRMHLTRNHVRMRSLVLRRLAMQCADRNVETVPLSSVSITLPSRRPD